MIVLGDEPVQVNPGSKCMMQLTIQATREKEEACLYARQVGSSETLGPFCTHAEGPSERLPGRIEWMWSADRPLRAQVLLTPLRVVPRQ